VDIQTIQHAIDALPRHHLTNLPTPLAACPRLSAEYSPLAGKAPPGSPRVRTEHGGPQGDFGVGTRVGIGV
jgi:hypothetical protein